MSQATVLCVDDQPGVAEDYARLIGSKMNLKAIGTSDPDQALTLLRENPISVLVLDQRMPQISGTELYREMRKVSPRAKAIMLTGEADFSEAADALQTLDYVRVVDKAKIQDLVPAVQVALARAEAARSMAFDDVEIGRTGIPMLPFFRGSTFYLQMIEMIEDTHVPKNLWRYLDEINAGQSRTIDMSLGWSRNFTRLAETEASLDAHTTGALDPGKFVKISSGLNSRIASRLQTQSVSEVNLASQISETLTLPSEPEDPIAQSVKARSFYIGPEIIKLRLRLREHIHSENVDLCHFVTVDHHTGSFVKKQVDTLTDGTQIERLTSRIP